MRVIVCGGRGYTDAERVMAELAALRPPCSPRTSIPTIVHGAARGADTLAAYAAIALGYDLEPHPADWNRYGRSAGPVRNQQMLGAGADLVIAFPGGKGTAHMVSIAHEAGVPVLEVAP